jgi:hypothetical protein
MYTASRILQSRSLIALSTRNFAKAK